MFIVREIQKSSSATAIVSRDAAQRRQHPQHFINGGSLTATATHRHTYRCFAKAATPTPTHATRNMVCLRFFNATKNRPITLRSPSSAVHKHTIAMYWRGWMTNDVRASERVSNSDRAPAHCGTPTHNLRLFICMWVYRYVRLAGGAVVPS